MINIEIVICTWNRAASLAKALDSVSKAIVPDSCRATLIVVNNASADDTASVLANFESSVYSIRTLYESRPGLSRCRNTAIDAADGDFIIWTDDDVLVSPSWLANYVSAFANQATVSFWGGPIYPLLPEDAPAWINENMEMLKGCFASRDLGDKAFPFNALVLPYGANFAVRTSVQKEFRFDETLGRKGNTLDGGEETELLVRLLENGHQGYWVPNAGLDHAVSPSRLSEPWMREYFEAQGRAMARSGAPWTRHVWWLRTLAWYHNLRYQATRGGAQSGTWLAHLIRSALASGQTQVLSD